MSSTVFFFAKSIALLDTYKMKMNQQNIIIIQTGERQITKLKLPLYYTGLVKVAKVSQV